VTARRRVVRVPASSANLGPGFDVLACALAMHVEVEVEETGRFAVATDLAIARDRRNLCVRAFATLLSPDDFSFRIRSSIPLSGGLGTSAAAIVAGLLAADSLLEAGEGAAAEAAGVRGGGGDAASPGDESFRREGVVRPPGGGAPSPGASGRAVGGGGSPAVGQAGRGLLAAATRLEGHPDNVAAALLGGFVVCAGGDAHGLEVPAGLDAVLVVPRRAVRTRAARAALPADVPMADAVFNVGHASLLVLGLVRGDLDLVARGLDDRLHQPHRAHLYPRSAALVAASSSLGALGATISGAGPTVLVWCAADATASVARRLEEEAQGWAAVRRVAFEPRGGEVVDG
jgi:homoserine kinase